MALLAPVKWAQRKESLYVTIALPDVKDEKLDLTENKLTFTGNSNNAEYHTEVEFLHPVVPKESTWKVLPHSIQMHIIKEDKEADFWPRLPKDKALEKNGIAIDWNKYVDEDEEEDAGGFDMSALTGGSGFGGFGGGMGDFGDLGEGGEGDSDDDDADLPDLEPTPAAAAGGAAPAAADADAQEEEEEAAEGKK